MWQKPVAPPVWPTWEAELRRLYVHSDMGADEFEALLEVALRGERPDHPDLPLFLALIRGLPDPLERVRT